MMRKNNILELQIDGVGVVLAGLGAAIGTNFGVGSAVAGFSLGIFVFLLGFLWTWLRSEDKNNPGPKIMFWSSLAMFVPISYQLWETVYFFIPGWEVAFWLLIIPFFSLILGTVTHLVIYTSELNVRRKKEREEEGDFVLISAIARGEEICPEKKRTAPIWINVVYDMLDGDFKSTGNCFTSGNCFTYDVYPGSLFVGYAERDFYDDKWLVHLPMQVNEKETRDEKK